MSRRPTFLLAQVSHDLRTGMVLGPALITLSLGGLALVVSHLERTYPGAFGWAMRFGALDVAGAQMVLGTVAASMMTVVSITYSVLVMALSLASIQFSPRILVGFLRDRASQVTLGLFIGTFLYALLILRTVHGDPNAFVAPFGVGLGVALAFVCLGSLLFFISHIAHGIQANFIVHNIAQETRRIMDEELIGGKDEPDIERTPHCADAAIVRSSACGYVQLVCYEDLYELAVGAGGCLTVVRSPGEYVVEGSPIAYVEGGRVDEAAVTECFDLGPIRTLQQDVEFGMRQIVDIALKAISPAVNDPSTCVTCIDNLASLLSHAAKRGEPPTVKKDASGKVRLRMARSRFTRLVDLSFHQIRQYGKGDLAVCLRIVRALGEVARVTEHGPRREALVHHAALLRRSIEGHFLPGESDELDSRLATLDELLAAPFIAH